MEKQRTIAREITLSGTGLHTAAKVNLRFRPAAADAGVSFIRSDIASRPVIKAAVENLLSQGRSPRRTSLGRNNIEIHTIEHLMATLLGLGIDNIAVEIDNSEIPGLDGSGLNFVEALTAAGIQEQDLPRRYYLLKEPIIIEEPNAYIMAIPSADTRISYTLSYEHPLLRAQFMEFMLSPDSFRQEIAPARTFCLEEEAGALRSQGVGQGASYNNTLVLGKGGVIRNKLRFPDEFVRHKILDLLGDLYVLGWPLRAHIIAVKSGHSLNLKLINRIQQQRQKYLASGLEIRPLPEAAGELDGRQIMAILPHRPPFLFVDKITSLEKGRRAVGIKNVTMNDYFFQGHFPGKPVMPGVIVIEAMAQVGGVMMLASEENKGKIAYFMSIASAKFRRPVFPGDQLVFEVEAGRIKSKTGQVFGRALVEGKVVAEAELMFALGD
jgi:UDP-3-O-[3-hydroxymyristoyl] N-acetylglucosamine deacetylase/3-hydroxyacyl-[acyl-carrier-protein] dehydratase